MLARTWATIVRKDICHMIVRGYLDMYRLRRLIKLVRWLL